MLDAATLRKIYLASRSSRRRELLKQIGVAFEVLLLREHWSRGPDVDEAVHEGESPEEYVQRVAHEKAETGWMRILQRGLPRLPVLAADTTVCLDATIFGKPANRHEAVEMLKALSGREHRVLTAVTVRLDAVEEGLVNDNVVRFRALGDAEIQQYVDTGEPYDKAGGYAIQGRAAVFIPEILGSYTGVMGLPLYETAALLRKFQGRA
ncbi:MAG: septum formation inhibitor Maf [Gammaproteobacteria bacterium]|nr:septum formation inhibitor Maf [Gammaproteobacteria bacterium]